MRVCVHDRETKFMKNGIKSADTVGTHRLQMLVLWNVSIFPNRIIWTSKRIVPILQTFLYQNCNNSFLCIVVSSTHDSKSYTVINLALQSCQHRVNLSDMKEWMWGIEHWNIHMVHWKLNEDLRIHLLINPETAMNKSVSVMIQRNNKA